MRIVDSEYGADVPVAVAKKQIHLHSVYDKDSVNS